MTAIWATVDLCNILDDPRVFKPTTHNMFMQAKREYKSDSIMMLTLMDSVFMDGYDELAIVKKGKYP